jgi:EAL domain-containing protein (putative c-di-GMP-specific phosphodiesterase class I)
MTLVGLAGLERLQERLDDATVDEFLDDVTAYLRVSSVNGASAGRLDDERFGIVHDAGLDVGALEQAIVRRVDALGAASGALETTVATVGLEAGEMSDAECAKALIYTLNKFSQARDDFTIREISEGYRLLLDDTRQQMIGLKRAIATESFEVLFQPIVELSSRAVHHYEALSRLHDSGPKLSPFELICFAEEVGLISDLDFAICKKVLAKIKQAWDNGDNLRVAVNLSPRSLESPNFMSRLRTLLDEWQAIHDRLLFEITESWKIKDLDAINVVLRELRQRGHHVCLDDFGAGAAAYEYVRALDVDYVKIDGSYVRESLTKPNGRAILKSMCSLCRDLGIETVGEQVETEEVARVLLDLGVRFGQGYLFGKPAVGMLSSHR